jgi:two-component system, NtrC family, nitrogen regulation response regulator GlnG
MVIDESTTLPSASVSAASDDGLAVPALTIIWHADVSRVGAMHSLGDLGQGESISLSRRSPEFQAFTGDVLPLDDPYLSRQPCLSLVRTKNGVRLVPVGTETSIFLDGKPLRSEVPLSLPDLAAGRMVTVGRRNLLCLHTTCLDSYSEPAGNLGLLGNSDAIRGVRKDILSVADMDLPVLIRGATGTGKELTAAAIAKHSRRASKPFVPINMGAVPAGVAEAELFGHQRGAFTGATESRGGYFGEADGGTLLLDEIGLAKRSTTARVRAGMRARRPGCGVAEAFSRLERL